MIVYDSNEPLQALKFEHCSGSNIPRAIWYTLPSVFLALAVYWARFKFEQVGKLLDDVELGSMWSASVIVLGVLLGMRTNKAYDRFWEGLTLVQRVRAEWFEAASNLVAFSLIAIKSDMTNETMNDQVNDFQYTLVRLMSLMHGAALRQIGGYQEEFHVLDIKAIDTDSLGYLAECEANGVNPVEVLLQWVQILVTDSIFTGVLAVPAPILTRCYQTLSRGMVNLHDARKLAECPFPYPLTQMVYVLLFLQCILTPIFIAASVKHPVLAGVMTFMPLFGMYSVTFTAGELEHPFGNDPNDLPLCDLQGDMNKSLLMLLDKETFRAPTLKKGSIQSVGQLRKKYGASRNSSMTCSVARPLQGDFDGWDKESDEDVTVATVEDEWVRDVSDPRSEGEHPDRQFKKDIVSAEIKRIPSLKVLSSQEPTEAEFPVRIPVDEDLPLRKNPDELPLTSWPLEPSFGKELVRSLAEECVGALTNVMTKLLHHATSGIHAEVIASDLMIEHRRADKGNQLPFHRAIDEEPCFFVQHLDDPQTDSAQQTAKETERSRRMIALGEETLPRLPPESSAPRFRDIPEDPVPMPSPPSASRIPEAVRQDDPEFFIF